MKRGARLKTRKRMQRSRKRINAISTKERLEVAPVWRRVKADVRVRSGGRCEVVLSFAEAREATTHGADLRRFIRPHLLGYNTEPYRCERDAEDGHHIRKPRRAHNDLKYVLDVCRACHEWFDAWHGEPRGRLIADPAEGGGVPICSIQRTGKFEARGADGVGQNR